MKNFKPCGVVTITTDFGHRGPFVGTMKGVMLQRSPDLKIIDLTHEAHVHWPVEAGFWLQRAFQYFPQGTVHLAVVDPGVGTERSVLVAVGKGNAFIAPDNGLLAEVIEKTQAEVFQINLDALGGIALDTISSTFHGRDIFAPLAAAIALDQVEISSLGEPTTDYIPSLVEPPEMVGDQLRGIVITTDNFGNLITNIEESDLVKLNSPIVNVGGHRIALRRTYADVTPGEYVALVNSYGVLEIACAEQSAAETLNIGRGAPVSVKSA